MTRAYRSPIREQQAELTRRAVLDAATECFVRAGYATTTVKDIADTAGVSAQTVYLQGSKAALLLAAVDRAIAGDDAPVPLLGRDEVQRALTADTTSDKLRLIRELLTVRMPPLTPILRCFREAAACDPTIAEAWKRTEDNRFSDVRAFVGAFQELLRPGLDVDRAADIVWAVALSPQVAELFLESRGWTADAYAEWAVDTLDRLILG